VSRTPRLFVVSGPSGVGKGTLVSRVRGQRPDLGLTVSATTRQPRPGEVDGTSYYFLSVEDFEQRVAAGEFLEWANVFGNRYGTLRSEVDRNLDAGKSVILEIDVQGALNVRKLMPEAVLVFIEPPSFEALESRLRGRGTEEEEVVQVRLKTAKEELELAPSYDERIVNDDLQEATSEFLRMLDSHEMN
jgi:guanylate kinase